MRRNYFFAVILIFIIACNNNRGWSAKDRSTFIKSCIDEASTMNQEQAKSYCECMQPKVESKYKTIAEVEKVKASEFQSPEWISEVKKCLGMDNMNNNNEGSNPVDNSNNNTNNGSSWSESDRDSWATTCAQSLEKQSWSDQAKKNYCDCVREKLEKKYSTFNEMNTKGTYEDGVEFGKQCAGALTGTDNQN